MRIEKECLLTPLLMAVRSVQVAEEKLLAVVRWLVEEAGADTKLCDGEGRTAAELAHLTKKFAVERYLLRKEKEAQADAAANENEEKKEERC